ncbi:MAG: DegT/DnrJ/EryC1/StrS family aminotransferase [Desulfovibrionaceae bacterium]
MDCIVTGSGKSALHLVLSHMLQTGVLAPKEHDILVPRKLGYWVYNIIQISAQTTPVPTNRTKAILVYHQYGFPQDMEAILAEALKHGWLVVEDCAHCLESSHPLGLCGTLGDYAIHSLSKFFPLPPLGAVRGGEGFRVWAKKQPSGKRWLRVFKELTKAYHEARPLFSTPASRLAAINMSYSVYHLATGPGPAARALNDIDIPSLLGKRRAFYANVRTAVEPSGLCDHLEAEGVTPYVIPLHAGLPTLERIRNSLAEAGVPSAIYSFDMARNMLAPDHKPCLCLPCDESFQQKHGQTALHVLEREAARSNRA